MPPKGHTKDHTKDPLKDDFRNFLYIVWQHLNLPQPTPLQYDIAEFLQYGPKRSIIEAFRGVGKSWITSAFVLWVLYNNPQKKILVVSASKERADAFTTFTKRLISEIPILQHLMARAGQRDSSLAFDVGPADAAHAPSVKSVGITGQIAGSRADLIIPDDIETPKNSMTQLMRDRLSEAIKEFDAVLTPKPDSRIIYLGTPQTEMSIYNRLPERGYVIRIWPARIPESYSKYEGRLAPYIETLGLPVNAPTDTARFDDTDLREREASYGRSGFALQFMLDTTLSDADRHPLKVGELIFMDLNPERAPISLSWASGPDQIIKEKGIECVGLVGDNYHTPLFIDAEWQPFTGSVMSIDPSGRGSDESTYAIVNILHGRLFLMEVGGFTEGYSDKTLEGFALAAKRYKVNNIIVESNFGDGMFSKLLQPFLLKHHNCGLEEVRHNTQKERRIIDTLEPIMNQHRLVVNKQVLRDDYAADKDINTQLFYQMSRITRDRGSLRHDDRLDAVSMAVAYWVEHMSRDVDQAVVDFKSEQLDLELERFSDHVLGHKPKGMNWLNIFD